MRVQVTEIRVGRYSAGHQVVLDHDHLPFHVPMLWWGDGFYTVDWKALSKKDWSRDTSWTNPAMMTDMAYDDHLLEIPLCSTRR